MKFGNKPFYLLITVALFAWGCRQTDETPPSIQISSPDAMSNFDVGSLIDVVGSVADETRLEWVKIELVDNNSQVVASAISINPDIPSIDFHKAIVVDDVHLESGNYFIKVSAFDGENTASEFVEITLNEIPLQLSGAYIVTSSGSSSYEVYEIDSMGNTVFLKNYSGEFTDATSNSYHQYLTFVGGANGNLWSMDPESNINLWNLPVQSTVFPYFSKIITDNEDHLTYASLGDGQVAGYNKDGVGVYNAYSGVGYRPEDLHVQGEYLFSEQVGSAGAVKLSLYHTSTGILYQELQVDKDLVGFSERNSDEVFVFMNDAGQGEMHVYGVSGNYFWEPHSVPVGAINDVARVDANEVVIAHESGLLRYTYTNNSMINIVPGINPSNVSYDSLNDVLLVGVGNEVRYYDRLGNLVNTVSHTGVVDAVLLYYNK